MAETKTRSKSGRGKSTSRKTTKTRRSSTPKTKTSQRNGNGATGKNGAGRVDSARKAVEGTAKHAGHSVSEMGHSVGKAARKAKTPLLAGGAAVAGAAGGLALGSKARKSKTLRRPKVKIRSQDLAKAARDVGQFGMDVGQLAAELRKNREQAHANGTKRRSPVEVVLEGLTHRGQ
jgi:hypothetical protein